MKGSLSTIAAFMTIVKGSVLPAAECLVTARAVARSDWDDGTVQGWMLECNGDACLGLDPAGGNPGGCIRFEDRSPAGGALAHAPPAFQGDYTLLEGASIRFQVKAFRLDANVAIPLLFLGRDGSMIVYQSFPEPGLSWSDRVIPLEAVRATVTEEQWGSTMRDVEDLAVDLDVVNGTGLDAAIDDFRLVIEDGGILIDFDDVDSGDATSVRIPSDRYRACGLLLQGEAVIENVRSAEPEWLGTAKAAGWTAPNALYLGRLPGGAVQSSIEASFVVPGTEIAAVTDYVCIHLFDSDVGSSLGTLEAFDASGGSIRVVTRSTPEGQGARYEIRSPGISRIRLSQDEDSGLFDNLFFHEPAAAGGNQIPSDCNQDGYFDISDAICIFRTLFSPPPFTFPCGDGSAGDPGNLALLDWDLSEAIELTDGIAVLAYLFQEGHRHPLAIPGQETTACVQIPGCPREAACSPGKD